MIRVGFVLEVSDWIGGINYYRSLLSALKQIHKGEIQPVLFVGTNTGDNILAEFECVTVVRSVMLNFKSPLGIMRRVIRKIFRVDPALDLLLKRHNIKVLSHHSALSGRSKIKTIGWIPDFQFLNLPRFFTSKEISIRSKMIHRMADKCDLILVSSQDAFQDLEKFFPAGVHKARVLHFVPEVDRAQSVVSLKWLEDKYQFEAPYFYLPNQFWAHKNHEVVIAALIELRRQGFQGRVLCTGNTSDYRNPNHFDKLMLSVSKNNLDDLFRVLGIVPYEDLLSLMRHSVAIINPSLCEGWSTTVEEAKALGKTILLSDIAVHKEQDPPKGCFFPPEDAICLAEGMQALLGNDPYESEKSSKNDIASTYADRRTAFGLAYQEIVIDLFR